MSISKKTKQIAPSLTLEITAKAKKMKAEGISIIGFGAGEPDFNTPDFIIESAKKYDIPLFKTGEITTHLIGSLNNYLLNLLAPTTILHGVMLDILGMGVLITGNAGIGKSETALELV